MAGINKVILVGNLGRDPEMRYTPNGVAVCSFSLATSETYKDKNTGERITTTEWHNIVLWRGLAETSVKYLRKGSQAYIEGKLKTRKWEDKEGQTRYTTEVVADTMQMLDRREGSAPMQQAAPATVAAPTTATPATQVAPTTPTTPATHEAPSTQAETAEDDLPF